MRARHGLRHGDGARSSGEISPVACALRRRQEPIGVRRHGYVVANGSNVLCETWKKAHSHVLWCAAERVIHEGLYPLEWL